MNIHFFRKILIAWSLLIIILLVIDFGQSQIAGSSSYLDKIVHFFLFGIFAWVHCLAYRQKKHILWLTLAISTLFSVVMELVQISLPWRTFSWVDILAGFLGTLIFTVITCKIYGRK